MTLNEDTGFLSRRGLVFLAIIGIHVLLVWGLNSGLSRSVVQFIAGPMQTTFIEEIQEEEEAPPPPPPAGYRGATAIRSAAGNQHQPAR